VRLQLGEFTFDQDARQLLRAGKEVHVSPKAFELLKILVEHRPRALSKTELHQQLWPDTFVSDGNLASLVAEIREALDDNARTPRFIRTAQRFGYAFCGQVADVTDVAPAKDATVVYWLLRDGKRIPLTPGENVLGRDAEGGIGIDSVTVSRRHACIRIAGTTATIEDLDSKNGTFVGGKQVSTPVPLNDGDEIRTGSVVMRFRMASPKGSTATWSKPEP
jgi:DNA-binding winged helix-turn-helix (wHTH) protein